MRKLSAILWALVALPAGASELSPTWGPGVVVPAESWVIAPATDGKIQRIDFAEGQIVSKGDVLIELDETLVLLELELVQAQLDLKRLELEEAEEDFGRQQQLKDRDAVSEAAFSDAQFKVEATRTGVGIAELELRKVQTRLESHKVLAPSGGVMSAPLLAPGTNFSVVESGPVAKLVVLDPIHVRAPIQLESVLARLEQHEFDVDHVRDFEVELRLANGVNYEMTGHVASVGFELDPETGEGSVLLEFPNPQGYLRPGMPVEILARER